jgi:hypothetical protein
MKPPSQRPSFRRATASLLAILLIAPAIVHPPAATASALPSGFVEELVAAGLAQPTAMAFLPDGRMLVTEKRGSVRVVKNGALLATPFIDLSAEVNDYWDRGLGGLAIDPAFATNGYVYLFYPHDSDGTDGTGAVTNRLVRVTAAGDVAAPGSMTTILGSVSGAGCPSPSADCLPQEWYGHAADTVAFGRSVPSRSTNTRARSSTSTRTAPPLPATPSTTRRTPGASGRRCTPTGSGTPSA